MIKGSINKEDIVMLNVHVLSKKAIKFVKQK